MRYLQNIVLLISVLGAAPAVLAAAPATERSGVEIAQPDAADAQPFPALQPQDEEAEDDDRDEGITGNDGAAVLAKLDTRARVKCLTKGRPGKNCYYSQCPGSKQCKVNARGNCVFKYTQNKRPSGCSQCLCYRSSI